MSTTKNFCLYLCEDIAQYQTAHCDPAFLCVVQNVKQLKHKILEKMCQKQYIKDMQVEEPYKIVVVHPDDSTSKLNWNNKDLSKLFNMPSNLSNKRLQICCVLSPLDTTIEECEVLTAKTYLIEPTNAICSVNFEQIKSERSDSIFKQIWESWICVNSRFIRLHLLPDGGAICPLCAINPERTNYVNCGDSFNKSWYYKDPKTRSCQRQYGAAVRHLSGFSRGKKAYADFDKNKRHRMLFYRLMLRIYCEHSDCINVFTK